MTLPRSGSFRVKLIILTTVTSAVAVLLVCVAFVVSQQMTIRRLAIENLSTQAQVIATHSTASLLFEDRDAGTETLAALAADPEIVSAFIYSQDGQVFASFQADPSNALPAPAKTDELGYHFDHDRLVLSCSIAHNGEFLGTLTVLYDMKQAYALARKNISIAATVAVVAILVSFGLAAWLNRMLAKPVAELDRTARAVSLTGDYSVRAVKFSTDELGRLTDTFNQMLGEIQSRDTEVEAKTLELSRVNDDLQKSNERLRGEMAERQKMATRLQHDASHDALTQLGNRSLFMEQINLCIERARRQPDYMYAVIFIDLDNFKMINDSLGHDHGDKLLIEMAKRLVECLRTMDHVSRCGEDLAARLGGDEFVILLDGIKQPSEAAVVAERIQKQISQPIDIDGRQMHTSASIGIAVGDADHKSAQDLLRNADTAMYRAKMAGKGRHELFDEKMHALVVARLQIESDLRRAIDTHQFHLMYQPIVSLTTGNVCGFESLIRWQHPDRGPVSPLEFIPVAEETGMIIPIGSWVLNQACMQIKSWNASRPSDDLLSISVNVSRRQMMESHFIDTVKHVLSSTGIDASNLRLEITESMIMHDPESMIAVLQQLRKMGIRLYMDDFGTGHSSLSCLHQFPIDFLKIDQAFVRTMKSNREYAAVVHAIIALAHNLGVEVVSEGIETPEQISQLISLECDYGQGYYFSKPLDGQAAASFLASGNSWPRSA